MVCGASPAPHPGVLFRGLRAPEPPGTFCSCKKYPKTRQNQGFGFLCLNWSLSDLGHLRTELGFCHLIYSGSINDTSASGPVKGIHVSRGANRSMVLVLQPREHPKNNRTSIGRAGDSKGGQASPFASSRKRGSRGRNPIERVSPSVRFFGYFLSAQKVTRVRAGEAREPSNRIAAICGKKFFSPARPAMGESERIGAMRWHRHGRKEAPT